MARKALIVKSEKRKKKFLQALSDGKKPDKWVRTYNRCKLCGRSRGYLRYFDICRICFREAAHEGHIPGIKKSSS